MECLWLGSYFHPKLWMLLPFKLFFIILVFSNKMKPLEFWKRRLKGFWCHASGTAKGKKIKTVKKQLRVLNKDLLQVFLVLKALSDICLIWNWQSRFDSHSQPAIWYQSNKLSCGCDCSCGGCSSGRAVFNRSIDGGFKSRMKIRVLLNIAQIWVLL